MKVEVKGLELVVSELSRIANINLSSVLRKNATEMFNRASAPPGTPRDTGELIQSRQVEFGEDEAIFGYGKEYAPHVEYGHRTRNGGFVPGQFYLKRNLETQAPILERDILQKLKGE